MKIEELMPQIRAGKKVTCKSRSDIDCFYFVVGDIAADRYEFGSDEPYTGFILVSGGNEWQSDINGAIMMIDDWELYDEPTQSV
jgi:hypothetical protein